MNSPTQPTVRYHGSKWRIAPWVISHFPKHNFYCEPFCGGAAVFGKKKMVKDEVINDLNGRVVNLFKVLRDPVKSDILKEQIYLTPYAHEEYYQALNKSDNDIEDARRILVVGWQAHGAKSMGGKSISGFRRGLRNNSNSASKNWIRLDLELDSWVQRLRNCIIDQVPAVECIKKWDTLSQKNGRKSLFYLDPPYTMESRKDSREVYAFEMSDQDHIELAGVLNSVKGKVAISGYNSELYNKLFKDWNKVATTARIDMGQSSKEVLWMNYKLTKQEQLSF